MLLRQLKWFSPNEGPSAEGRGTETGEKRDIESECEPEFTFASIIQKFLELLDMRFIV